MSTNLTAVDAVAMDGLATIATLGFFVPAAILVALVAVAVWRDRRRGDRDDEPAGGGQQD